jgi:uncharacterized membrane protein
MTCEQHPEHSHSVVGHSYAVIASVRSWYSMTLLVIMRRAIRRQPRCIAR